MLTGKFVTYLPIEYRKRVGTSKVRIFQDSLRTLQYVTEVIATYNPLKLFILMSGCLLAAAGFSIIEFFVADDPFFLLLGSTFLIGAFVIFAMGLLAFQLQKKQVS